MFKYQKSFHPLKSSSILGLRKNKQLPTPRLDRQRLHKQLQLFLNKKLLLRNPRKKELLENNLTRMFHKIQVTFQLRQLWKLLTKCLTRGMIPLMARALKAIRLWSEMMGWTYWILPTYLLLSKSRATRKANLFDSRKI